jgi:Flp pilus assembly pilin Flp
MMLARHITKVWNLQLDKRAVSSLEYAMIAMFVAVASVGAVYSNSPDMSSSPARISSHP